MKRIVLISCVKKKANHRAKARDMYISPLFRSMWRYAKSLQPDSVFILSAQHGLLEPDRDIDPYDVTLKKMAISQVRKWAGRVLGDLGKVADLSNDRFIFLASLRYRQFLTPQLSHVEVPMEGLGIGKQLQWLKKEVSS